MTDLTDFFDFSSDFISLTSNDFNNDFNDLLTDLTDFFDFILTVSTSRRHLDYFD
jgi:hypothetical protein